MSVRGGSDIHIIEFNARWMLTTTFKRLSGIFYYMVEVKTYRYKLYNRDALEYLDSILVIAGHIYNHCIALHRKYYALYHKSLNKYALQKHLTKLKKRYKRWNDVPSQAIQDITDRIDRSYKLFYSNLKKGVKTNLPHFQKSAKYKSFTTKQCGYKFHGNNKIRIGVKEFAYWNSRPFDGKVKALTVKRKSSGYYIYVVVEQESKTETLAKSGKIVGFDFSLKNFLVSSDGSDCSMPKLLQRNLNSLRNLSRKYSKSKGKRGSLRRLQKLHEKITNQRNDLHWKLAHRLCKTYDVMVFETLDLASMDRRFKKSINDFGFNAFLSILEYVAHRTGKTVMYADRYFASSQLCSECGYKNAALKDIGIREWVCPNCGTIHNRDFNAALNLQKVGASTFSKKHPITGAC